MEQVNKAVDTEEYSDLIALFARYFGWTIEDVQKLSFSQITDYHNSLIKILKRENGLDKKEEKEDKKEASMESIQNRVKQIKEGKKKNNSMGFFNILSAANRLKEK